MLLQAHQVSAPVIMDSTITTMELLHLTANRAMETVQPALGQPIQIEQAA